MKFGMNIVVVVVAAAAVVAAVAVVGIAAAASVSFDRNSYAVVRADQNNLLCSFAVVLDAVVDAQHSVA